MSSTSNTRFVYENVPWNHEAINASFEEVRIQDYLKAYKSTGRPPAPCPPLPADDSARIAMGLPPLFKPLIVDESASTSQVPVGPTVGAEEPPHPHVWQEQSTDQEKFQSLSAQTSYAKWSFEELRVQAILKGSGRLYIPPAGSVQAATGPSTNMLPTSDPREQMMNISARPGYEQHSQEEHRVAYALWKREMTSEEIFRMQAGATVPPNIQAPPMPAFAPSGVLGNGAGGSNTSGPWLGQSRSLPLPQTTPVGGVGNGSLFGPSPQRRW